MFREKGWKTFWQEQQRQLFQTSGLAFFPFRLLFIRKWPYIHLRYTQHTHNTTTIPFFYLKNVFFRSRNVTPQKQQELREWMSKKRKLRHKQWTQQLNEKRETEFKPFQSKIQGEKVSCDYTTILEFWSYLVSAKYSVFRHELCPFQFPFSSLLLIALTSISVSILPLYIFLILRWRRRQRNSKYPKKNEKIIEGIDLMTKWWHVTIIITPSNNPYWQTRKYMQCDLVCPFFACLLSKAHFTRPNFLWQISQMHLLKS